MEIFEQLVFFTSVISFQTEKYSDGILKNILKNMAMRANIYIINIMF